jgi:phosphohistidine phosphatase SixA
LENPRIGATVARWIATQAHVMPSKDALRRRGFLALLLGTALGQRVAAQAQGGDAAWRALAGDGAVAIIRHAKAPGPSPDPPGARLEDCATQRNLSAEGRAQAAKIGTLWRERRAKLGKVISSPWCRCRDTARLMGLGEPEIDHALYNLLARPPDRDAKVEAFKKLIREWKGPGALVLVTHGITMRAVVGTEGGEGGIVVVRPDAARAEGYQHIGTIPPPE